MHGQASAGDPWAWRSPAECFGFSGAFVFQQKIRPSEDVRSTLVLSLSRAAALPPSSHHACEQRAHVHSTSVPGSPCWKGPVRSRTSSLLLIFGSSSLNTLLLSAQPRGIRAPACSRPGSAGCARRNPATCGVCDRGAEQRAAGDVADAEQRSPAGRAQGPGLPWWDRTGWHSMEPLQTPGKLWKMADPQYLGML